MHFLKLILLLVLGGSGAYLLGSISSAILVCRLFGLPDPRQAGSHNPGATNVLRLGGRLPAALTLGGDVLKGFLPVWGIKLLTGNPWIISTVLMAAIAGHIFPVFFRFKGGKGVATAVGGLFGLSATLGAIFVFSWMAVFALCRYSSLSALVAIILVPLSAIGFLDERYLPALVLLAGMILWRHRENISRLLKGTEQKSSFRRSKSV